MFWIYISCLFTSHRHTTCYSHFIFTRGKKNLKSYARHLEQIHFQAQSSLTHLTLKKVHVSTIALHFVMMISFSCNFSLSLRNLVRNVVDCRVVLQYVFQCWPLSGPGSLSINGRQTFQHMFWLQK